MAMRASDGTGTRRPRPVASTSAPGEGPRIAKRATVSTGRGDISSWEACANCGREENATKEDISSQNEIIEQPNSSSYLGLTRPALIPHEEVIDALNRGTIAKMLLVLISALLVAMTLALIAATFAGVPASALIAYAKWLIPFLVPLFTMALGYYFGSAQHHQGTKR
jgi:hypothetical protein